MGLRDKIKNFINSSVDIGYVKSMIEKSHIDEISLQCLKHPSSKFFHSAGISNLQKDPSKIKLGEGVRCRGQLIVFSYGGKIEIGTNVFLGESSRIWSGSKEGIVIGNNVLISHNVFISDTDSHEIDYLKRRESFAKMLTDGPPTSNPGVIAKGIIIEDDVWISANVTILKGVTIGRGSIVGAGAIVTDNIEPFSLVLAQKARVVKKIVH